MIGVCDLRVLVQVPHIAMGRRIVEVEIVRFNVFAVIAFRGGQTEGSFFEEGVPGIPQTEGEVQKLKPVANTGQAGFPHR
mgnify:FL=1